MAPVSPADARPAPAPSPPAPSDELLARAFNAAPNGFVLVDAAGRIVAANPELCSMFGYPVTELVGASVEKLLPPSLAESHRGLRAHFFENPERRAMGAGRVLYARRSDGREFPVEIGLNPVAGADGTLVLASVVDISEHLAMEWTFRGLFDASPYGLVIVDDGGIIVMVNGVLAGVLGYTPAALVGQPLSMLLPERYRHGHDGLMAGYQRTGDARMMGRGRDLTALHRDGTELPVEVGLTRVRWQRTTMTLAAVSDISVRKRLELELRQANANLEQFTYVASHDLRSPLRGIADLVEWIAADLGPEPPPEVMRNLGRVGERVQRLERIIDDLLSYARAGRAATDLEPIDLAEVVAGVLELHPVPAGIAVAVDVAVPVFQGARTPLEIALRNLVGNAVKHHDRDTGRIVVRARADDSFCVVEVTDDGPGIPAGATDRIFKLFQTLSTKERRGSGIGLALTKRVVEVHGGRIEVASPVADGRGATFRFWWPRFPRRFTDDP